MHKGYKVRLFPTPEQEELLWKHIHACRFIWNYMLTYQEENYKNGGKYLNYIDLCKKLTVIKKDTNFKWLSEVNNWSLQQECRLLDNAYIDFFKNNKKHPVYKKKKDNKYIYPVRGEVKRFYFKNNYVKIPNITQIKYKTKINIPQGTDKKFINPYVSYNNGKWILSFSLEFENQEQKLNDFSMGIDLGIKELAVIAVGDQKIIYHNINKTQRLKKLESKRKHIQKNIFRKYNANGNYKETNNIKKYKKMYKEICYKLYNIRSNYIHQITHELVSMLPKRVIMENLDIYKIAKNKQIAKQVFDQCWSKFIRQMKYKCEWAGIEFVQADRFYPSSKTCSQCGEIKKDLKLSDRVYKCPCCGLEIDRDYNAAINLMKYESQTERLSA